MDCVGPSGCQNGGECRTSEHRKLGDASAGNSSESAASCDCPLGFGGDHCQEGEGTRARSHILSNGCQNESFVNFVAAAEFMASVGKSVKQQQERN